MRQRRLHPVFRGVYLVGHEVAPALALERGAIAACGQFAVLSHRTAAGYWAMSEFPLGVVEVTLTEGNRRSRRGLIVHRSGELLRREIWIRDGLPITCPERAVLDLGGVVSPLELAEALDEARARKLVREHELHSLIARFPRRRGTRALRELLEAERGPGFSKKEAERRMHALIHEAGLPPPRRNVRVAGYEVDFYWPEHCYVLEVDGYAFHSRPSDFERDRRRDQDLVAAGIRCSRVTWRQIEGDALGVIGRLATALVRVL